MTLTRQEAGRAGDGGTVAVRDARHRRVPRWLVAESPRAALAWRESQAAYRPWGSTPLPYRLLPLEVKARAPLGSLETPGLHGALYLYHGSCRHGSCSHHL